MTKSTPRCTLSLRDALPISSALTTSICILAAMKTSVAALLQRFRLLDRFLDRADHVERLLGQVVVLRSEEHTSELQSLAYLVRRLLLEKKKLKLRRGKSRKT